MAVRWGGSENTNSPFWAVATVLFGLGSYLWQSWSGLLCFCIGFAIAGLGTIANMKRAALEHEPWVKPTRPLP